MTVSMQNVTVTAGDHTLLHDITLELPRGKVTGLIGPNGAGKSTLLAALSGDMTPAAGRVRIEGIDPYAVRPQELARLRAVMLQDVSVSFAFLVRDVVEMGRRPWAATSSPQEDDALIDAALESTGVTHLQHRDVMTLSGGERARVALARVLAQQTPVVFFDEPTAAMDVRFQEQSLALIRSLAQAGATVVVVLHDLNAAAAYCDHFVCLKEGQVMATGDRDAVFREDVLSGMYDWPVTVHSTDAGVFVMPQRPGCNAPNSPTPTPAIDQASLT